MWGEGVLACAMTVAQEPIVADALKSVQQHVDQEATDELIRVEGHGLLLIVMPVVLSTEANLAIIDGQQAAV
jgi:hypothetical protein